MNLCIFVMMRTNSCTCTEKDMEDGMIDVVTLHSCISWTLELIPCCSGSKVDAKYTFYFTKLRIRDGEGGYIMRSNLRVLM